MDDSDLHQQIGGISTDVRYIRENIEKNRISLEDAHEQTPYTSITAIETAFDDAYNS